MCDGRTNRVPTIFDNFLVDLGGRTTSHNGWLLLLKYSIKICQWCFVCFPEGSRPLRNDETHSRNDNYSTIWNCRRITCFEWNHIRIYLCDKKFTLVQQFLLLIWQLCVCVLCDVWCELHPSNIICVKVKRSCKEASPLISILLTNRRRCFRLHL